MSTDTVWDYVIVGGGSAGTVTATRLAAGGERRVLLLEAGGDQPSPRERTHPLADASRLILRDYNWDYLANLRGSSRLEDLVAAGPEGRAAVAEANAAKVPRALWGRFPYQLGKVMGGGSAVNGAIALRGLPRDFDEWVRLGNPEWSWEHVLPYYREIESDPGMPTEAHGDSGPVPIRRPVRDRLHVLDAAFRDECVALGLTELDDLNGGTETGVGVIPSNAVDGERMDTATTYLAGARHLPNLEIRTGTRATRVLFEGTRAVGVEVLSEGHVTTVRAANVILSAGAVGTPVVLMRSGVAAAGLSETLGVDPVVDLPGVGENLVDHPSVVIWSKPRPGVCTPGLPWRTVAARMSSGFDDDTDIQVGLLNNVESGTVPGFVDRLGWPMVVGISVMLLRPASRGRVFIEDAGPHATPVIELGLGTDPEDVDRLCHGVRKAWGILRKPGLADRFEETQFWTDTMVANDRILRSGVRNIMNPGWHAAGSCRMGPASDPAAVVDQEGRVHGTENLRIVDASVFPSMPSVPTNLTTIMLAERIAGSTKE
ncbi:GMC family oxidoreductase [Streptomyces caatingaensis]|uniref:Glucose-methanol-choline oxidoreductase n=1 Tax=Streptomyces caatingaensis TaxID=1678637 RepID=A0A0K9XIE0_9ACTN|nr:GMC family oxidoreductase N-terminal domain-containing protein [Streptomyces caatingaensis]KNB52806.1 glucose-methanol-choline oxidoreductase [Streptomyces caatingaensis]